MSFRGALPWLLYVFATCLPIIVAQTITPSDANSTVSRDRRFILATSLGGGMRLPLDPLTDEAGAAGDLQQFRDLDFVGPLVLTDDPNTGLQSGDISFIRCDLDAYTGPQQLKDTVAAAVQKRPGVIVLYSISSIRCSAEDVDFKFLYTATDPEQSAFLEQTLQYSQAMGSKAMISLRVRGDNSGGNGNAFTKSPTTAVAMIVLYSITGIITALFLVIIVVGAIRAHRHPERYGPRHGVGRPRQSRAKGIARAMLETIPIVKFGDREDDKATSRARDVEMESGSPSAPDPSLAASEAERQKIKGQTDADAAPDGPEVVMTETATGANPSNQAPTDTATHTDRETLTDNGLACSVCTDDFVKGQDIRVLPCNHKFHPECIDPWLLNVSGTCPLCRVDLRPTTTYPESPSDTIPQNIAQPHETPASAEPVHPPNSDSVNSNRRSRTGLSLHILNPLNIRRMRDATPEERIAALRDLRTVNHTTPSDSDNGPAAAESHQRSRLGARLSRAWGTSSRPSSGVPGTHAVPSSEAETRRTHDYS